MSKVKFEQFLYEDDYSKYSNLLEIPKRKREGKNKLARTKKEGNKRIYSCYEVYHSRMYPYSLNQVQSNKPSYSDTIEKQINSLKDVIEKMMNKTIFIIKFVHNRGYRTTPKEYNNYCEFTYRVNKNDAQITKSILLSSKEIEVFIEKLNKIKGGI